MIRTGRRPIRALPVVLLRSGRRWASLSTSSLHAVLDSSEYQLGPVTSTFSTNHLQYRAELDRTIFSLDKAKRLVELKNQRDYIIKRLNSVFQKTWFGRNSSGAAVDLEDMAYAEVSRRMVELMYVKHESGWIDPSLKRLTGDFIQRIEERFTPIEGRASLLQNYSDLDDPFATTENILAHYPEGNTQLTNAQDMQHFLLLCQLRGQKSVPPVPSLDENFEFWFKKDSLWQSDDLEAVVDQDVGRTRIL